MSKRVLGLFAKWPAPGAAKTRLALSPEGGAAVARAFLRDALARLAGVEARRVVAFAPASRERDFRDLVGGEYEVTAQVEGDLGRRLEAFIGEALRGGAERVVVVGADSPTLPVELVGRAFAELDAADVVLGPATDGGYYLLGCRRLPPVFAGVEWSGARVLAQTVERLGSGWRLVVLPPWYDVDTPEGWAMLAGHVAALRRSGQDPGVPHTERLLGEGVR